MVAHSNNSLIALEGYSRESLIEIRNALREKVNAAQDAIVKTNRDLERQSLDITQEMADTGLFRRRPLEAAKEPDAEQASEINDIFRDIAKLTHPDIGGDEAVFKEANDCVEEWDVERLQEIRAELMGIETNVPDLRSQIERLQDKYANLVQSDAWAWSVLYNDPLTRDHCVRRYRNRYQEMLSRHTLRCC